MWNWIAALLQLAELRGSLLAHLVGVFMFAAKAKPKRRGVSSPAANRLKVWPAASRAKLLRG